VASRISVRICAMATPKNKYMSMKYRFLLIVQLCCVATFGQYKGNLATWLSQVDDTVMVARLLIPGSHDAATGEGFVEEWAQTYAVTQDVGLALQFESGIRAFDLRPVMHGDTLQIAHGRCTTRITFGQAIDVIASELDRHPTEFAIVLVRNESDTERGESSWAALMRRELDRARHRLAYFGDSIRTGQLRGKILLISRDAYDGEVIGATVADWPDQPTLARGVLTSPQGSAPLLVQDYYSTAGERQSVKNAALTALLDLSAAEYSSFGVPWILNYASAYAATDDAGNSLSRGYRQNAVATAAAATRHLAEWRGQAMPSGVVFMDFAGVDSSDGYAVGGLTLTKWIIQMNVNR